MLYKIANFFRRRQIRKIASSIEEKRKENSALARHEIEQLLKKKKRLLERVESSIPLSQRRGDLERKASLLRSRVAIHPNDPGLRAQLDEIESQYALLQRKKPTALTKDKEVQRTLQAKINESVGAAALARMKTGQVSKKALEPSAEELQWAQKMEEKKNASKERKKGELK